MVNVGGKCDRKWRIEEVTVDSDFLDDSRPAFVGWFAKEGGG